MLLLYIFQSLIEMSENKEQGQAMVFLCCSLGEEFCEPVLESWIVLQEN